MTKYKSRYSPKKIKLQLCLACNKLVVIYDEINFSHFQLCFVCVEVIGNLLMWQLWFKVTCFLSCCFMSRLFRHCTQISEWWLRTDIEFLLLLVSFPFYMVWWTKSLQSHLLAIFHFLFLASSFHYLSELCYFRLSRRSLCFKLYFCLSCFIISVTNKIHDFLIGIFILGGNATIRWLLPLFCIRRSQVPVLSYRLQSWLRVYGYGFASSLQANPETVPQIRLLFFFSFCDPVIRCYIIWAIESAVN